MPKKLPKTYMIFNNNSDRWVHFNTPHQSFTACVYRYVRIDVGTTSVKELKEKIVKSLNADLLPGTKFLAQNTWIKEIAFPFTADDIIIAPKPSKDDVEMSWNDDVVLSDEHLVSLEHCGKISENYMIKNGYRGNTHITYMLRDIEIKISTEVLTKKLILTQEPPVLLKSNTH